MFKISNSKLFGVFRKNDFFFFFFFFGGGGGGGGVEIVVSLLNRTILWVISINKYSCLYYAMKFTHNEHHNFINQDGPGIMYGYAKISSILGGMLAVFWG